MKNIFKYTLICLTVIFLCPLRLWADFGLSVIPYESGNNLRFGRVDEGSLINKEIKIRTTGSGGVRYQVFQRVLQPFVNERGERLDMGIVTSYMIANSNSGGTLYQQTSTNLSYSDQLLYSSNSAGDSDSFRAIYTAQGDRLNTSGNFIGKIIYTLRPIGEGTEQTYILDVLLEASREFRITVRGSSGERLVRLATHRASEQKGYITLSFEGKRSGKLEMYQEIVVFPQNERREEIKGDCIRFFTTSENKARHYYPEASPLKKGKTLVYSTEKGNDEIAINFILDEDKTLNQTAGIYRGRITYLIEGGGLQETIPVDIEIVIEPVFEMNVKFPKEGLRFFNIHPTSGPVIKEAVVTVHTNLGQPYVVTQNIRSPLITEKGKKIPSELFTIKEELVNQKGGRIAFEEFVPVPQGEAPLFFSDQRGSSAQFRIFYKLTPNLKIAAGTYSMIAEYSLGER